MKLLQHCRLKLFIAFTCSYCAAYSPTARHHQCQRSNRSIQPRCTVIFPFRHPMYYDPDFNMCLRKHVIVFIMQEYRMCVRLAHTLQSSLHRGQHTLHKLTAQNTVISWCKSKNHFLMKWNHVLGMIWRLCVFFSIRLANCIAIGFPVQHAHNILKSCL